MGQDEEGRYDRYRSVNNKDAEDVLLIQEVLTCDQRMGTENRDLYSSFLKYRGTWNLGVPNIELMMQLIHSRKLWKQTLSLLQELQEFPITLEEVFTIKGSNIYQ
jgi:hypothetical protein